MQRLLTDKLVEWKSAFQRKPLLVRGVPQCGKTFLLKEFGEEHYENVVYYDFKEDNRLSELFEMNHNPQRLIKDISLLFGNDIKPKSTLIIFDEINYCQNAFNSLGHFSNDAPDYHIIAACSTFETVSPKIDTLTLFPMNFYEFIMAQNQKLALHLKENSFKDDSLKTFGTQLEEYFRDFQITGGMPEVVKCWIESGSIEEVERLQSRIISGIENDFSKIAPISMFPKLRAIWEAIPVQLSKENRKFIFSRVKKSWRSKDLEDALYILIRTGLVYKVSHIDKPDFPLYAFANQNHFKLYMCDTGLLRRTAKIPASVILDTSKNFMDIKGAIVENIVCNELKRIYEDDIYYWSAENPGRAEVEFIIRDGSDIIPIVAKAGTVSRTRSLLQYAVKFNPKKSVLTSPDKDKKDVLPLYAFWNLKEWLSLQ
ncbi:MAG: DUF4143 domain-containing protein [Oscillospiraceae bacterium]|nr:DUF4143 domain-containing protein [Oscillospiraceae bacterium]